MTKEELDALIKKVEDNTVSDDEKLLILEELNKGADELIALAETMPDVAS